MKERIEQIKTLYKVAEDFQKDMSVASNAISPMKIQLSDEIQAIDDLILDNIVSCALGHNSTQSLGDELTRKQQFELTLNVISEKENEIRSILDYKVMASFRKAEVKLNELCYDVVTGEVETDKAGLLLTEMGDYLKTDKIERLNKELLRTVSD